MAPPTPNDDGEQRPAPLLPTTGVDSSSVFDLPYATDELALPPPPDLLPPPPDVLTAPAAPPVAPAAAPAAGSAAPTATASSVGTRAPLARSSGPVVPPTFSKPEYATESFAPPRPAPTDRGPAPLPAPLAARPLSGPALGDDDHDAPLPPMVAKGWEDPAAATGVPDRDRHGVEGPDGAAEVEALEPSIWSRRGAEPPRPEDGPPPAIAALSFSPDDQAASYFGSSTAPTQAPPASPFGQPTAPPFGGAQPMPVAAPSRGTRLGDGVLVAAAAAAVAGAVWWAVVAVTERQFAYLALLLGFLVGQSALVGGRRGSIALGAVTGLLTLTSLTLTQYFITRSLAISQMGADVPLWEGWSQASDVIRATFEEEPLTGLFVVIATVAAGFQAGMPGKRASGSLGSVRATRSRASIL